MPVSLSHVPVCPPRGRAAMVEAEFSLDFCGDRDDKLGVFAAVYSNAVSVLRTTIINVLMCTVEGCGRW